MSYSIRGTSCIQQTMAYTSNHKFLPLHADVYKKQYTYMLQYPGNSIPTKLLIPSSVSPNKPEVLKTYFGKECKNC